MFSTVTSVSFAVVMDATAGRRGRYELMSRRWSILGLMNALSLVLVGPGARLVSVPDELRVDLRRPRPARTASRSGMPARSACPTIPRPTDGPGGRSDRFAPLADVVARVRTQPRFLAFTARHFVFAIGAAIALPLVPLFYVRVLGAPDAWIGLIGTTQALMLLVGYAFWRRASRARGSRFVLIWATFGAARRARPPRAHPRRGGGGGDRRHRRDLHGRREPRHVRPDDVPRADAATASRSRASTRASSTSPESSGRCSRRRSPTASGSPSAARRGRRCDVRRRAALRDRARIRRAAAPSSSRLLAASHAQPRRPRGRRRPSASAPAPGDARRRRPVGALILGAHPRAAPALLGSWSFHRSSRIGFSFRKSTQAATRPRDDADPERRRDRNRDRLVDALDDGRDQRLRRSPGTAAGCSRGSTRRGRRRASDRRAARTAAPNCATICGGTPSASSWVGISVAEACWRTPCRRA